MGGHVLDREKPIVIIAEPGREQEAALRLGRIGFDHVKGYVDGGMAGLAHRPDLVWPTERLAAPMIAEELLSVDKPMVLDIRNPREFSDAAYRGRRERPAQSSAGANRGVPHDRKIVVHCAGGYRSSMAASILAQHGITNVIEMAGGIAAWNAAKLPVESGAI